MDWKTTVASWVAYWKTWWQTLPTKFPITLGGPMPPNAAPPVVLPNPTGPFPGPVTWPSGPTSPGGGGPSPFPLIPVKVPLPTWASPGLPDPSTTSPPSAPTALPNVKTLFPWS